MKIALITDAWSPQVNGVVTSLLALVTQMRAAGHVVLILHPYLYKTIACPGYEGIDLAFGAKRSIQRALKAFEPDAIHIATEGPLGWATRGLCRQHNWAFTTAYHTRFPEVLNAALRIPLSWGYALFRRFHSASSAVLVPTQNTLLELQRWGFTRLRPWTHGVDTTLFEFCEAPREHPAMAHLPRPIHLYVGRVSYEKNLNAFLSLKLPGSKVVVGDGPLRTSLENAHKDTAWLGEMPHEDLPSIYGAADVFVFPSVNETFGLVMVEALACGTPVAAFNADGPREVLGATERGVEGGVLHESLHAAAKRALKVPRFEARLRALRFCWQATATQLVNTLEPARNGCRRPGLVWRMSRTLGRLVNRLYSDATSGVKRVVTQLSHRFHKVN